jgi:hypothetical protein
MPYYYKQMMPYCIKRIMLYAYKPILHYCFILYDAIILLTVPG